MRQRLVGRAGRVPSAEPLARFLTFWTVQPVRHVVENGLPAVEHHDVAGAQLNVLARSPNPGTLRSLDPEHRHPLVGQAQLAQRPRRNPVICLHRELHDPHWPRRCSSAA